MFKSALEAIWNPWGAAAAAAVVIVGSRALRSAAKVVVCAGMAIKHEADTLVDEARSELEQQRAQSGAHTKVRSSRARRSASSHTH